MFNGLLGEILVDRCAVTIARFAVLFAKLLEIPHPPPLQKIGLYFKAVLSC
jgi:hypothetical protein